MTQLFSTTLNCYQINLKHSRVAALNLAQLIIDLNLDIILIQEPYASKTLDSMYELKHIPAGYSSFHNLTADHAYGAAILAKSSLNAKITDIGNDNCCFGIQVSQKLLFISLYCRPSLNSIPSFFTAIIDSIPARFRSYSIIGCDINFKNKIWK